MEKKRPNIFLYTLLMIFLFIIITEVLIWGYGAPLIYRAILLYPQGNLVISEAVLALLVLIVMLTFKNSYVFTQKKEKLSTSLYYGLFFLIFSGLIILINGVLNGAFKSGLTLINITLGCLLVGVCEEFLCRGWLLNEFLERFGDSKKGIWYSIIISGVIFGLMHIGNMFTQGQDIITTISQVLNAAAIGIIFGLIYYKTKNIWSVIILHGLWDFSIFLGDAVPITSATESYRTISIISFAINLLIVLAELINIIPYLKDIDAKPKKSTIAYLAILSTFLYLLFTMVMGVLSIKSSDTYEYGNLRLDNYAITKDNYSEYKIEYFNEDKYSFKLSKNKQNNLVLTNLNTEANIEIECDYLIDYIILEQKDYYVLGYVDYVDNQNYFLYYTYLPKEELSNEDSYLDNIKNNMKKYLVSSSDELVVVSDYENDISYISNYDVDYGYFVLVNENDVSILNRD